MNLISRLHNVKFHQADSSLTGIIFKFAKTFWINIGLQNVHRHIPVELTYGQILFLVVPLTCKFFHASLHIIRLLAALRPEANHVVTADYTSKQCYIKNLMRWWNNTLTVNKTKNSLSLCKRWITRWGTGKFRVRILKSNRFALRSTSKARVQAMSRCITLLVHVRQINDMSQIEHPYSPCPNIILKWKSNVYLQFSLLVFIIQRFQWIIVCIWNTRYFLV